MLGSWQAETRCSKGRPEAGQGAQESEGAGDGWGCGEILLLDLRDLLGLSLMTFILC